MKLFSVFHQREEKEAEKRKGCADNDNDDARLRRVFFSVEKSTKTKHRQWQ